MPGTQLDKNRRKLIGIEPFGLNTISLDIPISWMTILDKLLTYQRLYGWGIHASPNCLFRNQIVECRDSLLFTNAFTKHPGIQWQEDTWHNEWFWAKTCLKGEIPFGYYP